MTNCFHCGDPVPEGSDYFAEIEGVDQPMCCIGCKTVSELITQNGMSSFYELRDSVDLARPIGDIDSDTSSWSQYDQGLVQEAYTYPTDEKKMGVKLFIDAIYCNACAWLIERSLLQLPGIGSVQVNVLSKRVLVEWDPRQQALSAILSKLASLGYSPRPVLFSEKNESAASHKQSLKRLVVAGFGMMQVMTYSIGLYLGEFQGIDAGMHRFLTLISMLVATLVVFYSGAPFFRHAYRDLRSQHLGMDVPIAIAIGGAYFASVGSVFFGNSSWVYFDSAVMFIFFLSISRHLESSARHQVIDARTAVSDLMPAVVEVNRGGTPRTIPFVNIKPDDQILIRPDGIIPADGSIDREGRVDESMLTGESNPCVKKQYDEIYAGTKNIGSEFVLTVARVGEQTTLASIERMLNSVTASDSRVVKLADKIAEYFIAWVLGLAVLVAAAWFVIDSSRVFEVVLAVLVVSCPCALSLAVPTASLSASQALRKRGILLINTSSLERLLKVKRWFFDKTGTLTQGLPEVVETQLHAKTSETECLKIAAALEQGVGHPIAHAFSKYASGLAVEDRHFEIGEGVEARLKGERFRLGKLAWASKLCRHDVAPSLNHADAQTPVILANEQGILAVFLIEDRIRAEAKHLVDRLKMQGKQLSVVSGDRQAAVARVAQRLGIKDYHSELLPHDKLAYIQGQRGNGEAVVMVGDGINDAPVLAAADVSITLSNASSLAKSASDIVILSRSLNAIETILQIAQRARRISVQNITWALLYNITAFPLAASGLLQPWIAALGMSLSSLFVVLNAMRVDKKIERKGNSSAMTEVQELPA